MVFDPLLNHDDLRRWHPGHGCYAGLLREVNLAPDLSVALAGSERNISPSAQAVFARSLQRGLDAQTGQQLRVALQADGQHQTDVLRRLLALLNGSGTG